MMLQENIGDCLGIGLIVLHISWLYIVGLSEVYIKVVG